MAPGHRADTSSSNTVSYTVAVVVPPVSDEDTEAWAQLDALIAQENGQGDFDHSETPPPPVFQEFHDRLTERYPCLSTLPDQDIDDGIWSDGPMWNNFGHHSKFHLNLTLAFQAL